MAGNNPLEPNLGSPENTPSFTSASRGYKARAGAVSESFEAVNEVLPIITKNIHTDVVNTIDGSLRRAVDEVRQPLADAAVATPPEIDRTVSKMGNATKALASGKINETYYWTLLDSAAKSLRNKFPGFADEIDRRMSSLVGTTPANRLAAMAFQDAQDKTGDSERRKWVDEITKTATPASISLLKSGAHNGMSTDELRVFYAQQTSRQEEIKRISSELSLRTSIDTDRNRKAEEAVRTAGARVFTDGVDVLNNFAAANGHKDIYGFISTRLKDPNFTSNPTNQRKLLETIDLAEKTQLARFDRELALERDIGGSKAPLSAYTDPNLSKNVRENIVHGFNVLRQTITNPTEINTQLLKAHIEATQKRDAAIALSEPELRTLGALKEIAPDAVAVYAQSNIKSIQAGLGNVATKITLDIMGMDRRKGDTLDRKFRQNETKYGTNSKAVNSDMLESVRKQLADPKIPLELKANYASALFRPDGESDFLSRTPPDQRADIINKFLTPDTIKTLQELDKTNLLPGASSMAATWVTRNTNAMVGELVTNIKRDMASPTNPYGLKFNRATANFEMFVRPEAKNAAGSIDTNRFPTTDIQTKRAMENFQKLMNSSKAVFEMMGAKGGEDIARMLKERYLLDVDKLETIKSSKGQDRAPTAR